MIQNLPVVWDLHTDVLAIGSGIGGLAAAITARENGAGAMVLERSDQVGGVTALSMGEVWVAGNHLAAEAGLEDSVESGFRYLKRLAMEYGEDAAILNFVVHAREALSWFEQAIGLRMGLIRGCPDYYYRVTNDGVAEGRMLEIEPFPAELLGEWQERTRVSPSVPYALTHHDIARAGGVTAMASWDFAVMAERLTRDERCLGAGLAAAFVKGALDRDVPLLTGMDVQDLIGDGERIVGVRAVSEGRDVYIRAELGVVVAVSSYERDAALNRTLGQQIDLESVVFPTIDGANFRLTGPVGARVARVPDVTLLGFHVPGEEQSEGVPLWRSAITPSGMPHTIVVNGAGERFGNEAFYRAFSYAVDRIDGGTQTHPNFPCWIILDSQARDKYPFGSVMPCQPLPDKLAVSAMTLAELAEEAGIDREGLAATVATFNLHAEQGGDPLFARGTHPWSAWMCGDPRQSPNPNLGTLSKPPFYAVRLTRLGGSAIPSTGIVSDHHARAIDWRGQPIPGLYVAGNSAARLETGAVMQSGISNARGMTHGWLAARHATGDPSHLLAPAIARMVPEAA